MAKHLPLRGDPPIGIVFSGGGARGTFQVGVWEVLQRGEQCLEGLPDVISGTSAGSLNGALIAAGLRPPEMLDFWLGLAKNPPVTANYRIFRSLENALFKLAVREPLRSLRRRGRGAQTLARMVRSHLRVARGNWLAATLQYLLTARFDTVSALLQSIETAYLFSTDPMRRRLADTIGGWSISKPKCRLAINTVDVRTGRVVRFVNKAPRKHAEADASHYRVGPIDVDMILASASIPLLFNPVRVGDQDLWDGGLLVNTPIAPAVALGATRIIPVLVTAGSNGGNGNSLHFGTAVERLADAFLENAYSTDRKLLLERNKLAEALPARDLRVVELYNAIRPTSSRVFDAGSYLYFQQDAMISMYESGRAAARAWLAEGPCLDTHPGPHKAGEKPVKLPLRCDRDTDGDLLTIR